MLSRVICDLILGSKVIKFVARWLVWGWISFEKKRFSSNNKCKLKMFFGYDVTMASRSPYDTHLTEVINCAKSGVCTPGSFIRVKAHVHTYVQTGIAHFTLNSSGHSSWACQYQLLPHFHAKFDIVCLHLL